MSSELGRSRRTVLLVLWLLVLAVFPVWVHFDAPGWDVAVYAKGMRDAAAGLDPYEQAMAVQRTYHASHALQAGVAPPYSYVYSPITLPLLRGIAHAPEWLSGAVYWLLYALGALAQIWVGMRFVRRQEFGVFAFVAPLTLFFPGLLANGTVQSGNIAYILYALVFSAAVYGWRRQRWGWFYAAVLIASCVKAPLLSLVVIAPLSARRQILPAVATVAAGVSLFGFQPMLWPSLFRHYLQAVELQFSYNRDFGCSPAGLFSAIRFDHGLSYAPASYFVYLAYALPLLGCMFYLSRRFFRGDFTLQEWAPLLLVGTILLNPRLLEYDVAPITLPLALLAWRWVAGLGRFRVVAASVAVAFFVVANGLSIYSWEVRKRIDGPLLVILFVAGAWTLLRSARAAGDELEIYRETPSRGELAEA
ncbi:hypothetical protein Terro_1589 [Terriglobus roseus DSM 18391]|uniref:DUF2029 domain-containing protein n=1 Tax=Terriglobus roseus (strain DSM 18391 / NRRL B-41598 / KBS 63) TaxID=926566 RepID=I3ZF77_TERRK|nr:hypothetical protein [Terriglobus roseus]AFL87895.1 hypothetical protein Terro_1589 [Terriglobus roseus DSM 18391]